MSNKKQSSVDWLIEQLVDDGIIDSLTYPYALSYFEKARAMHREEVEEAYLAGLESDEQERNETEYYTQTFETK